MSTCYIVYIHCNGCGVAFADDATPGYSVLAQREDARKAGWHVARKGGVDICPNCWSLGFGTTVRTRGQ